MNSEKQYTKQKKIRSKKSDVESDADDQSNSQTEQSYNVCMGNRFYSSAEDVLKDINAKKNQK